MNSCKQSLFMQCIPNGPHYSVSLNSYFGFQFKSQFTSIYADCPMDRIKLTVLKHIRLN